MLIRQNTPPKSPTCLTNEQIEAWMRANPDRVKRLDNEAIQAALTKPPRKSGKVEISFGKKAKQPVKPTAKPLNRLQLRAKQRDDWLRYLRSTNQPMTIREVKEMFGIGDPKFAAGRINQDGDYISITKEIYKNRKTLLFRAIKQDKP